MPRPVRRAYGSRWHAPASKRVSSRRAGLAMLRLIASQVGAIAPSMRGRRSHAERLGLALELLADSRYDALLEGPTRFEDMPAAMPRILAPGGLCHVIS